MGLFDFFKKKTQEEPLAEKNKEDIFKLDDIEVEPPQGETAEFVLEVDANADKTAAVNQALSKALGAENIQIFRANEDTLYQEIEIKAVDLEAEAEIEITQEDGEIFASESEGDSVAFVEAVSDLVEEILEKPSGEEEILVTTAAGDCFVEETKEEADAFVEELVDFVAENLQEEKEQETAAQALQEEAPVSQDSQMEETKMGFFARLKAGLDKTRKNILGGVDAVLGGFTKIDEDLFEELEEALIMADMGVQTTMNIVENLRKRVKREHATDPSLIKGMLADEITAILSEGVQEAESLPNPSVILVIGVNGVGKTTTIGKLASRYKTEGRSVLLAAADTFRAAAIDQLEVWGQRSGIEVIKQEENSDPAAVVFDAVHAAKNQKCDLLICDTAGRLHNKKNLMEELRKIGKVIEREHPNAHKEVYLVLDATTGQNALQQAKLFQEVADITGIILTKLDGTAKGGIVVAIKSELQIPVRYIGVGESINDLQKFDAREFAKALFGE
ncbi:MAG: signal recognition particle-docking protein FtsY [Anaerotignum sp.]|nr:signal recognition particle-docking protein FtsY [Anaerotignum sp.]